MFGHKVDREPPCQAPVCAGLAVYDLSRGAAAEKAVVTFHTTSGAMAFEQAARTAGLAGRLTTIPRQVTAGCGYAWTVPLSEHNLQCLAATIREAGLDHEGVYLL